MTKQVLGQCAVEMFNNGLVSVNFSAPMVNSCFVVFHFFGQTSHKLAPWVDLKLLRPLHRALLVNQLKNFHNFSRIFTGKRLSFFVVAAT